MKYFFKNIGVKKDFIKAKEYLERSANNGSCLGQFLLSRCYMIGLGVEKDTKKAWKLCTTAANSNCAIATDTLASESFNIHPIKMDDSGSSRKFSFSCKVSQKSFDVMKTI